MTDQASDALKCHWVKLEDGQFALIPGCWDRVHNPEAECTCGQWSASHARQIIKNMRSHLDLARHENQILRAALRAAGLRALASGEAVEILRPDVLAGTGWRDGSLHIAGDFHTLETVKIDGINVDFGGCSFSKLPGSPDEERVLEVANCSVTFHGPFRGGDRWAGFEPRWRIKVADADYIRPPPSMWGWGADSAEASRPITPPKPPKKPKALRGRV